MWKNHNLLKGFFNFFIYNKLSLYYYNYIIIKYIGLGLTQLYRPSPSWFGRDQPKKGVGPMSTNKSFLFFGLGRTWPNHLGWAETGPPQHNSVIGPTQWLGCMNKAWIIFHVPLFKNSGTWRKRGGGGGGGGWGWGWGGEGVAGLGGQREADESHS